MVIHLPASYTSDDPVCSLEKQELTGIQVDYLKQQKVFTTAAYLDLP